jgi:hypothetical protein
MLVMLPAASVAGSIGFPEMQSKVKMKVRWTS